MVRDYLLGKRVDMELLSEEHSWGSSSNEPFFSSAFFFFFLTESEMLFVGHFDFGRRE